MSSHEKKCQATRRESRGSTSHIVPPAVAARNAAQKQCHPLLRACCEEDCLVVGAGGAAHVARARQRWIGAYVLHGPEGQMSWRCWAQPESHALSSRCSTTARGPMTACRSMSKHPLQRPPEPATPCTPVAPPSFRGWSGAPHSGTRTTRRGLRPPGRGSCGRSRPAQQKRAGEGRVEGHLPGCLPSRASPPAPHAHPLQLPASRQGAPASCDPCPPWGTADRLTQDRTWQGGREPQEGEHDGRWGLGRQEHWQMRCPGAHFRGCLCQHCRLEFKCSRST